MPTMDTQLVEKIVHEVKSQGVFDEFRKDSMADVDTKPAYQNLRQRVENTVKKFLSEQKWTPETNKNQLREKLRRHITESGFLDVGVERIVDQVVNPKIGSVFQPRIEEIAYKYLGLPPPPKTFEPPPPPLMHPLPPLPLNAPPPLKVETCSLLPTDLEQVSPDSDNGTVKCESKDDGTTVDMDTEDKLVEDDDESPPFEPLEKQDAEENKYEVKEENVNIKQECEESLNEKTNKFEESNDAVIKTENMAIDNDSQQTSNFATESAGVDKEASQSMDARISQDSQLSSVSSDSRLSVNGKEDSLQSSSQEAVAANISEEAQMPKFNENSCEPSATTGNVGGKVTPKSELHFDIKKDEIKFEGTERKTGIEIPEPTAVKSEEAAYLPEAEETPSSDTKNESFNFNANKSNLEAKEEDYERTPNAQELSFGSSIEDSSSVPPNQTPKLPAQNKERDELPQTQTPKQGIRPNTPTTTPIPTPPLPTPTPTATPSPVALQKPDKDHQSRHSSSSSSKHKKHSKERRRSYEREKEKDSRDRHRSSKDSKESSKYHSSSGKKSTSKHYSSSSSSKYSSSHNKSSEKDVDKSSSSSTHFSSKHTKHSHSHSSSSSNENPDSKKSKRDSDRRHHSSSSKRNERKDDHAEAKHKTQRRKSTDSNDDDGDKSMGGAKSSSQYKSSYSTSSQSKSSKTKSNSGDTNKANDTQKDQLEVLEMNEQQPPYKTYKTNNVVILNDILENPQTQFIQLNNTGRHLVETPVQQQQPYSSETDCNKLITAEFNNNNNEPFASKEEQKQADTEPSSLNLLYFDNIQLKLTERLLLLNATMDLCRSAVNSLRFDSLSDEGIEFFNEEDIIASDNNKTILLTKSLKRKADYNYAEFETTPRKRMISNESEGCESKTSPTPSDTSSVNSKENEEFHKNTNHAQKPLLDRHKAAQKLNQQQRYSSEDLYKPRPILGQRSRRRGMDSVV